MNSEFIGARVTVEEVERYKYLVFYGKKNMEHGQPYVYVYNSNNEKVAELTRNYSDIDNERHQYVVELPEIHGDISIIFNWGYIDNTGNEISSYTFSEIYLKQI